jgi:hypothetical protein
MLLQYVNVTWKNFLTKSIKVSSILPSFIHCMIQFATRNIFDVQVTYCTGLKKLIPERNLHKATQWF